MGEGLKITLILMSVIFLGQLCWAQDNELKPFTSMGNMMCAGDCTKSKDLGIHVCYNKNMLDFCSPSPNTDYKGNKCRDDHPCDLHGEDHHWCYNDAGEKNFCGKWAPRRSWHISSRHQRKCLDECIRGSRSYYWCITDKDDDYCSPRKDFTYKYEACRADHPCGTHGYDYTWCYTASGWDYCGLTDKKGF